MAPGQPAVPALALIRSGLEEQEGPWHPSPCKNMLRALGQVFCPSPPRVLIRRAGINTHILPLLNQSPGGARGKCTHVEGTHTHAGERNRSLSMSSSLEAKDRA